MRIAINARPTEEFLAACDSRVLAPDMLFARSSASAICDGIRQWRADHAPGPRPLQLCSRCGCGTLCLHLVETPSPVLAVSYYLGELEGTRTVDPAWVLAHRVALFPSKRPAATSLAVACETVSGALKKGLLWLKISYVLMIFHFVHLGAPECTRVH